MNADTVPAPVTESSARPAGHLSRGNGTAPRAAGRSEPRDPASRGGPVAKCPIELRTEYGQRVYRRVWDRLKADLYVITVRSRTVGLDDAARTMEAMISEEFESVRRELENELARSDVLRESVKVDSPPDYPNVLKQDAQYSTPRALEFLMLILQMDALLQVYDYLWLSGIIDTHARVQRSQNWQRRLTKVANRMRELGNRTRSAATREIERRTQKPGAAAAAEGGSAPESATEFDGDEDAPAPVPEGETEHDLLAADAASVAATGADGAFAGPGVELDANTTGADLAELGTPLSRTALNGHG